MTMKGQITEDMKTAMKAGDKDRLKVVRLILAAIKQIEVDTREELDDAAVLAVLAKMVKQRRDSIEAFEKAIAKILPRLSVLKFWCWKIICPNSFVLRIWRRWLTKLFSLPVQQAFETWAKLWA